MLKTAAPGTAEEFAALLAGKLEALEKTHPRGPLSAREAAAIATRRSFYEVRAAHSPETKMWASRESTAWTVVLENDPRFQVSCLNRFIYVKAAADLTEALQGAELVREKVSTVGLACGGGARPGIGAPTGPLGREADLPAGPDAASAPGLAA